MIEFKSKLFLLEEIVKRNFAAKYKGSILGIFWSFFKPLLIMILLTIIFSTLFGGRIENYPVYVLSGKCIFDFFNASTNSSMMCIKGNQNIFKRTAAPKYIFVLGSIFSEFINFLITLIILAGVMVITNTQITLSIFLCILPIIALFMMSTGIGLILSIITVYYTDIQHLWNVVIMMLMYSTAIFYPMDIIPDPYYKYMILNPLFWVIDQFRDFLYLGINPSSISLINLLLVSAIILIFGIIIYKKYESRVVMRF